MSDSKKEKQQRREATAAALAALMEQHPAGAAFGVGSPAEVAQQPGPPVGTVLGMGYDALGGVAQRALGASEMMRQSGIYDPAPIVDAALLPISGGMTARLPVYADQSVLGAGPIRAVKAAMKRGRVLSELARQDDYQP